MRKVSLVLSLATAFALGCSGSGDKADGSTNAAKGGGDFAVYSGDIPETIERTPGPGAESDQDVVKGQYMVKLKSEARQGAKVKDGKFETERGGLHKAMQAAGVKKARAVHMGKDGGDHAGAGGLYMVESDEHDRDKVRKHFQNSGDVEWVEPVVKYRKLGAPTDPYYQYQWNLAELDIGKAHDKTMGKGAIVAVVDSGVSQGADGYANLLPGYDFAHNDSDASDTDADKTGSGSHGTHVAGTIAQATSNGEGVAGMAPQAKILPVRVFGYMAEAGGVSTTSDIVAAGIVYAVDNGANVINLSLGGYSDSQAVRDACTYAYRNGVAVIAASGNDGFTDTVAYPAAYDTTLAVGATGPKGEVAYYSNQGPLLDVVAPGGDMTTDFDGDGVMDGILQETTTGGGKFEYALFQGTSMASPHVAGLAALLYSKGITDPADIYEAITESAKDLGSKGRDDQTGFGLIDPVAALNYTPTGKGKRNANAGKGGKSGGKAGKSGGSGPGAGKSGKSGGSDSARGNKSGGKAGGKSGGKGGKSGKAGR